MDAYSMPTKSSMGDSLDDPPSIQSRLRRRIASFRSCSRAVHYYSGNDAADDEEAATHIDALEKRVGELEAALKDIAGASWGWIAYEKGPPMTHKALTIDRAMKALDIKLCPVCKGMCEVQINHGHDSVACEECTGSGFVSTLLNGGAKP